MRLFFRSLGEGIPIIILHGLFGSSDNWIPVARKIAERYRVVLVDLRNHGLSPHSDVHTYQSMENDLVELLDDLNIDKAHILGHSMGGKVAMKFAIDYPDKTISLIVADILPRDYLKNQPQFHQPFFETIEKIDLRNMETRKEIENEIKKITSDQQIINSILKNLRYSEKKFEWKINVAALKTHQNHLLSQINFDNLSKSPAKTNYPVLFIKGSESDYITDYEFNKTYNIYQKAKLETIIGTTHWLHFEKPDELSQLVTNFLESN